MNLQKTMFITLFVLLFSSFMTLGCQVAYHKTSEVNAIFVSNQIRYAQNVRWIAKSKTLGLKETPRSMYFVDRGFGWIITDSGLFRTTDAGNNWIKLNIPLLNGEEIRRINFINQMTGVVILEKKPNGNLLVYEIRILKTNDAGETWTDSYSVKGAPFFFVMNDGKKFWISGIKYEGFAPLCFDPLVISSEADSKDWIEDSSLLNAVSGPGGNKLGCTNHAASAISMSLKGDLRVLVSNNIVYEKAKDEVWWKKAFDFQVDTSDGITKAFGQNNSDNVWFVEGFDNEHGTRGRLFLKLGDGSINKAVNFDLFFTDATYISDNQFIISGSKVIHKFDQKTKKDIESRIAVILQTDDNGDSYREIFTNPTEEKFVSINPLGRGNKTFWVLGESGAIVELKPAE